MEALKTGLEETREIAIVSQISIGQGKSTLLGLIGGLDSPTRGQILNNGVDITQLNERELTRIRNEKIGFVFQFLNLIPTFSALENISLPIARTKNFNATRRAKELLEVLNLGDRTHHRPNQLSRDSSSV